MKGPNKTMSLEEVQGYVGKEIGVSDWFAMDQDRISAFADITEDHMFLHVDPEAAAQDALRRHHRPWLVDAVDDAGHGLPRPCRASPVPVWG